jgi:hypothetical protein
MTMFGRRQNVREFILVILLLPCLLVLPVSAQDNNSSSILPGETISAPPVVGLGTGFDLSGYPPGYQGSTDPRGCPPAPARRFYERLSYTGDASWLPTGSICLTFSDNYKWIVHDFWIDRYPKFVGKGNCLPIELIRCYYADYYHIIGTSLVMSVPRAEVINIRPTPLICTQDRCQLY